MADLPPLLKAALQLRAETDLSRLFLPAMANSTPLSPAAQAVLDAYFGTLAKTPQQSLAAALRAAADQVVPEWKTTPGGSKVWQSEPVPSIRAALLAIAAELEGQQ